MRNMTHNWQAWNQFSALGFLSTIAWHLPVQWAEETSVYILYILYCIISTSAGQGWGHHRLSQQGDEISVCWEVSNPLLYCNHIVTLQSEPGWGVWAGVGPCWGAWCMWQCPWLLSWSTSTWSVSGEMYLRFITDLFKCLISTGRRMRPWGPSSMKSITLTPLTVRLNCPLPLGTVLPTSLVRYQPFQYCLISLTLMILPGPEFMLMQWIPCSLSKLITFISLAIGRLLQAILKVF